MPNAFVSMLDETGEELERTATNADGGYEIAGLSTGPHHIVIPAHRCEPAIVTVAAHPKDDRPRDIALQDWNDPAANLSAAEIGARRRLTSVEPATTGPANGN